MIGKRQRSTRILQLILGLLLSCKVGHSQVDFESKAVEYFCSKRLIIDPTLKGMDIIYSWSVEAKPSKVYDIANCMGDINLLKDSIPNKTYLGSLEQVYSAKQYTVRKIRSRYVM